MSRIPTLGPRGEGWFALQAVTMLLILVAARWAPEDLPGNGTTASFVWLVGWLAFAAGLAVLGSSLWLLQRAEALTALPRPIEGSSMVASGPYRFVRHPIYAGLVLAALGVGLFRYSPLTLALAVLLFAILDVKRRREEAWLTERYPGYASYRTRTRALVPFVY